MYVHGIKTLKKKSNTLKNYLVFLKELEASQKLEIISELSNSMIGNEEEKEKDKIFFSLSGKLKIDKDIDAFLLDIRNSRIN